MQLRPSQLKPWRLETLAQQDYRCALCGLPLLPTEAVADHCHAKGHLRGAIHRSCNSVLGKVERGKRYGRNFDPLAFASGLHSYLSAAPRYPLHPSHNRPKRRKK